VFIVSEGEPLTARLISRVGDSGKALELTPAGHEASLECDHRSFLALIRSELDSQGIAVGAFSLARVAVGSINAGENPDAPPVVSWLSAPGRERFLLDLQPELPLFEGHFPEHPILPGIIQLHWAVLLSGACLGHVHPPQKVLQLKYHNIAVPPRLIELSLEPREASKVRFHVSSHGCTHARGVLVFAENS
jgi:hypothetical protein